MGDLRVKWFMVIYMTVVHLMALYGLYQLFLAPKLSTVLLMVVCYWLSGALASLFGDSYWRGVWMVGALRYVAVLHGTWCVNSIAHWYGSRPYADINPAENWFVTAITGGEGWHNYHHTHPADYSAGELGWAGQFNPTTLFIDVCAAMGLVTERKKYKMKT